MSVTNNTNKGLITLYKELSSVIAARLEFYGIDEDKAEYIALGAMDDVRKNLAGIYVYFPKAISLDAEARRRDIYESYKAGKHISEIAINYGLSMQRIYTIIAEERKIRRAKFANENINQ